jgi:hypothetical protein
MMTLCRMTFMDKMTLINMTLDRMIYRRRTISVMALGRMTLRQNERARERMRDEETMDDRGTKTEREKKLEEKDRKREKQRGKTGRKEKRGQS